MKRTNWRQTVERVTGQTESWVLAAALTCAVLLISACGNEQGPGQDAKLSAKSAAEYEQAGFAAPEVAARGAEWLPPGADDGNWLMSSRDYGGTRYSPLDEIDSANVDQLELAWTFDDGVGDFGHEMTPLVKGNTMYIVTPFPNKAYALDLTNGPGVIKWSYSPNPSPTAIGKACCDAVNRGAVLYEGKLIYNLLDDHTVAVDAETGKELWRTRMANVADGVTMTMAPTVVGGKVYVGNSGGEMGVTGWLAALDADTGTELWRAFSVGPDSMARIGEEFNPFYAWMRGKDLGATTWPGDKWKHGAGAAWGFVSYDPELDMIYYGTSNTGPWNADQRPGLNLWTSGILARNAGDGMARWAYIPTPHNEWDYDGVNENILVDLRIDGKLRKVMVHFNRNGYAYTIDRVTGEVLVAKPFAYLNWSTGIDSTTMMPIIAPDKHTSPPGRWVRNICPADIGAKNWQPAAFSPRTGLFYVPVNNVCMDYKGREVSYIAGTPYWGAEMTRHVGPGGNYGEIIAFDAATGQKVWGKPEKFLTFNGVLVTATDLVFYGTVDGWFRALDAHTGKELWSRKLGSGISSPPMTYRGPDGHQYVVVAAGVGGGAMVTSSQAGFPPRGSTYYVFSLGSNVPTVQQAQTSGGESGTQKKQGAKR